MNLTLVSSLLGAAAFILHVATLEELSQAAVSVWPPGSKIYLGECVILQCRVTSNSTFAWTYRWYKDKPHTAPTPCPRHLVSGDSYSITVVTTKDVGSYWCKAEQRESNATVTALPVMLNVSVRPPPSLTLNPSSRLLFQGEHFTVRCPASRTKTKGWRLMYFSPRHPNRITVNEMQLCSSLGGAVGNKSDMCVLTAASKNSGLYWCEDAEGRTSAVSVTVSNGSIILKTPALPVYEGDKVVLYCQYRTDYHNEAIFFKNGAVIGTFNSSSSNKVIDLTIMNVTLKYEGFYKCASKDRKLESPESWLSMTTDRGIRSATEPGPSKGNWKWIVVSFGIVLLLLIPLTVWLVKHNSYRMISTRSCCPIPKEDVPAVPLPETKQDATEVQWDLSWMEMSNLLDKQLYHST
ncbi:Fc receptor-like protein 3 [Odontesthes bonariensis]|uniref:Fc receptor-like protein 3 n=1 Tax=Odontesthes bonariensis TaxID=219752 RepID=UPI003F58D95C